MKRLFCIINLLFILGNACAQQAPYYLNNAVTPPPPFENLQSSASNIFPLASESGDTIWLWGVRYYGTSTYDNFLFRYNIKDGIILGDTIDYIIDTLGHKLHRNSFTKNPIILNGNYYATKGFITDSGATTCLLKIDTKGHTTWLGPVLNSNKLDEANVAIKRNSNHLMIVVGQQYEFTGYTPSYRGRIFLSIMDTLGNIISTKFSTQQVGMNAIPAGFIETESGVIVIGYRQTNAYLPPPSNMHPMPGVAVLFRNNGTQKVLKVGREDVQSDLPLGDIAQRNDTEYLIRTKRSDTLQYYHKDAIMCIDSALNVKWIRTLDSTNQYMKKIGGIIRTQDNNFVINGSNPNIERTNEYGMYGMFYDPFLYKIDSAARYIWKRNIVYNDLFTIQELGRPYELPDGGFLLNGRLMDVAGLVETPFQKMWVVRTDKYGCLVPGCELWDDIDEKEADAAKISYYPNPFQHELYIFNPAHHLFYKGEIIDLSGKVVKNDIQLAPQTTTIVPLAHLSRGVYILKLVNDAGEMQTHKIIKN